MERVAVIGSGTMGSGVGYVTALSGFETRLYDISPEALAAIEALLRTYRAEAKGRQATPSCLVPLAQEVYESVETMCEWQLGHEGVLDEEGRPVEIPMQPLALDEIIACLKRVRKSINRWSREGGRQGYLTFVSKFIP